MSKRSRELQRGACLIVSTPEPVAEAPSTPDGLHPEVQGSQESREALLVPEERPGELVSVTEALAEIDLAHRAHRMHEERKRSLELTLELTRVHTHRVVHVPEHGTYDCFATQARTHTDIQFLPATSITVRADGLGVDVVYEVDGKPSRFAITWSAIETFQVQE